MQSNIFSKACALSMLAMTASFFVSCNEDANQPVPSLKTAFSDAFLIGGALSDAMLENPSDPGYAIVKSEFNTITAENCMKWARMNPEPGVYELEAADALVEYGTENNMALVGHTLFWHSQTPDWVFQDDDGNDLTREALLSRMRERATLMAERWGDKIEYWDVVNESIEGDGSWRKSKFQQIIGDDFTEQGFRIAAEVLPANAKLLYNDYSMTDPERRDAVVAMVKDLQSKGVRIDGIGMQGHWTMKRPEISEIVKSIEAFASTGLKVHITELDLDFLGRSSFFGANVDIDKIKATPENNPYPAGILPSSEEHRFALRYAELFKMLLEQSEHIERVTFWGVSDKTSWLNNFPVTGRTNFSLLFDRQFQKKIAYEKVIKTAANH